MRRDGLLGTMFVLLLSALPSLIAAPPDGNRLAYLDEVNPYYPHKDFPKLITPQWVGEPGVEAVVVLAIDDMRDPERYETLSPADPEPAQGDRRPGAGQHHDQPGASRIDPRLQAWLKEGLSIEVHTISHPCPLLQKGDFAEAAKTYHDCVDLMNKIPGNKPVAFRMPCCDSINIAQPAVLSPRSSTRPARRAIS